MLKVAWILVCLFAVALVVMSVLWFRAHRQGMQTRDSQNQRLSQTSDSPMLGAQHSAGSAYPREAETPMPDDFDSLNNVQDADRTVLFSPSSHPFPRNNIDPLEAFPYLRVVDGPDSGNVFPLRFSVTSFGRGDSNAFQLKDDAVSRHHFEVEYVRTRFWLRDSGSTNGTFCNDKHIDEVPLEFGDEIQFGETLMIFSCAGIELLEQDPKGAAAAFEKYLDAEPEFLLALKNLAFLLERDIRRKSEAEPLWKEVARIEKLG